MPRTLLRCLFVLCCLTLSTGAWSAAIWEVSDGENTVLVGATVHLLKASDFPLPEAYDRAFDWADSLYIEADLEAANSMEFAQKVAQSMMYTDGNSLQEDLSEEVWEELQAFSAERNFPVARLTMFTPAFISMTLTVFELQRLGLGEGVDHHYHRRALAQDMPVGFLEELDEVLDYLQGMNDLDSDRVVLSTIRELEDVEPRLDTTVAAWREGDMERVDELMGVAMREEFPQMHEALLVERNRRWLDTVEALLADGERALILAGALHMAGPDNLLELAEQAGLEVTRYASE